MGIFSRILKSAVAALALSGAISGVARAQDVPDTLFDALRDAGPNEWRSVEAEIRDLRARSGSPSIDLLLAKGNEALEAGDTTAALEHLTALTDHAPEFAEGFHARARGYFMIGRYGPALSDLERALALAPRHFDAMIGLGVILEELGDETGALSILRRAHELHPNQPDLNQLISRLEASVGAYDI